MAALRTKYGAEQLPQVRAVFPDWTDEDILIAIGEAGGLVEVAIGRIAEGGLGWIGAVENEEGRGGVLQEEGETQRQRESGEGGIHPY